MPTPEEIEAQVVCLRQTRLNQPKATFEEMEAQFRRKPRSETIEYLRRFLLSNDLFGDDVR